MSNCMNQDLWKKAWGVSQGIRKLKWACIWVYFDTTVEQALKE